MITNYAYLICKAKITTMPEIKAMEWNNSFSYESPNRTANTTHLVAFSIRTVELATRGNLPQDGTVDFDITLLSDCLYENDKRYLHPDSQRDHFIVAQKINKLLHGQVGMLHEIPDFATTINTPLDYTVLNTIQRTSLETYVDKAIMRTKQAYRCLARDFTAQKQYNTILNPNNTSVLIPTIQIIE